MTADAQRTQPRGIALMALSALLACLGQYCWKLWQTHGIGWVAVGLVLYAAGALAMVAAYRYGQLSVLQPILALSYALSVAMGVLLLGEQLSAGRLAGVALVVAGVVVIAREPARGEP